jgi:hypothetical protein
MMTVVTIEEWIERVAPDLEREIRISLEECDDLETQVRMIMTFIRQWYMKEN